MGSGDEVRAEAAKGGSMRRKDIPLKDVLIVIDDHIQRRTAVMKYCTTANPLEYGRTKREGRDFLRNRRQRERVTRELMRHVRMDLSCLRAGGPIWIEDNPA